MDIICVYYIWMFLHYSLILYTQSFPVASS